MNLKQNIKYTFFTLTACAFNCDSTQVDIENFNTQNIEVQKVVTLGGSKNESAQSIVATLDGGYAVLGFTQSMDGDVLSKTDNSYDFWLLKFDVNGEQEWQKVYGGIDDDRGQDVITTKDGGYTITGSSKSIDGDVSENAGLNDFWVVKINDLGIIEWETSLGHSGTDKCFSILQTQDNGFLVSGVIDISSLELDGCGSSSANRHAGGDYWIIKLDAFGTLLWSKSYGGSFSDTAYSAVETQTGDFIIVGSSDSEDVDISNNKGSYDFWVLKLSSSGNMLWEKSFGGSEIDRARDVALTSDGNFLITGDSRSSNNDLTNNYGVSDIWIIKIDPNGELIWEKSFGGSNFDGVQAISIAENDSFLISGNSRSSDIDLVQNKGNNDAWIFSINFHGIIQWQTNLGGSNIDLFMDVVELENGSVVAVGNTNSNDYDILENKGFSDILLIQIKP
mgnify:CR=1 FL=1